MENIINNFLWYEYEGKIFYDIWYKNIIHIQDKKKQKKIVKNIFRKKDIQKFYQLGNAIWNISNLFKEDIDNDLILEKYFYILENNNNPYVDLLLLEYHIWLYNINVSDYKFFLENIKIK